MQATCFKIVTFLTVFLLSGVQQARAGSMDYELYQLFLDQFGKTGKVINGIRLSVVDYKTLSRSKDHEASLYRQTLAMFNNVDPSSLKSKEEKVAFWINAYNIGAIKMIVDHYPIESIRSRKINWLKNPWKKNIIAVGGNQYSLSEIEHEILLKQLKEPMAHFAIVCASVSCPDLSNRVYQPTTLKDHLAAVARAFLANNKKGLKIDKERGKIYFSKIFKFDSHTFPNGAKDALPLIAAHVGKEDAEYLLGKKYSIKYFDYDWSANDLSRTR